MLRCQLDNSEMTDLPLQGGKYKIKKDMIVIIQTASAIRIQLIDKIIENFLIKYMNQVNIIICYQRTFLSYR